MLLEKLRNTDVIHELRMQYINYICNIANSPSRLNPESWRTCIGCNGL